MSCQLRECVTDMTGDADLICIQERTVDDDVGVYSGVLRKVPYRTISRINQHVLVEYSRSGARFYGPPPLITTGTLSAISVDLQ